MTELQKKLLEILKALDTICRKHDIEYFLVGGSALGAIRHNGFIPWDDDIDLGMRRSEWERFREIAPGELPEGLSLMDRKTHPTYCNHIGKIVDDKSTALYRASLADGCPKGQYIEIFIHDSVPAAHLAEHKRDFLLYCEMLTPYMSVFSEKYDLKGGLTDDEMETLSHYMALKDLSGEDRENFFDRTEEELGKYSLEESDYTVSEWGECSNYFPAEGFRSMREVLFEDIYVPVAAWACDNLRVDYGNTWMYLPPVGQRFAHIMIDDVEISGDKYMDIIQKQTDKEATLKMRLSEKTMVTEALPSLIRFDKDLLSIRMEHARTTDRITEDLAALYRNGNYSEICDIFDEYIRLKRKANKYSLNEDIREESREMIASSLLMLGRLDDAEAVMNIPRIKLVKDCADGIEKDIVYISRSITRYYDGLYDEADTLLSAVDKRFKNSLPYRKMTIRLGLKKESVSEEDLKRYLESAESLIRTFPNDPEIIKIKGDCLLAANMVEKAVSTFRWIINNSENGMDVLEASKTLKELGKEV